jgi:hypothetical protein
LDRRNNKALDVLHELEDVRQRLKNLTTFQQEALGKEIGYFTTHSKRMDYKQAKAKGEPVGSGVVESIRLFMPTASRRWPPVPNN